MDPFKWDQGLDGYCLERMALRQCENELEIAVRENPADVKRRQQLAAVRARLAAEPEPTDPDGERILDKVAQLLEKAATPFEVVNALVRDLHMSRNAAERWVARVADQRLPMARSASRLIIIDRLLRIADTCITKGEEGRAIYALEKAIKACEDPKEVAQLLGDAARTLKGKGSNDPIPPRGRSVAAKFGSEGVFYLMAMKQEPQDEEALSAWVQAGRPGLAEAMPKATGDA